MTSLPTRRLGAAAVAATLLFAACGDDDDDVSTATASSVVDDDMDAMGDMDDMDDDGHDLDDDGHGDENGHDHGDVPTLYEVDADGAPTIDVVVEPDPDGGFTVVLTTTNFTFVPEDAGDEVVEGEGHVHVYVDGVKVGRAYGERFDIEDPGEGTHVVRVEFATAAHSVYAIDGQIIEAVADFEGTAAGNAPAASAADTAIEISYADGATDGDKRYEVSLGDTVAITVTSDIAEELHVHGYDEYLDLVPGEPATVVFVADIAGVFEVELEGAHTLLFDLAVS